MKAKIKCFRCGWCGSACNKHGNLLTTEQIDLIDPIVDWNNAVNVNGDCCPNGDGDSWVTVTHDMAIDAGEPEMEGMLIKW